MRRYDMKRRRMMSFTLIELLTVVAIIGILAAMLLPALQEAREKARQAVCMSNLKQCGITLFIYAQDYNEYLPLIYCPVSGNKWSQPLQDKGYVEAESNIFVCPSYYPRKYLSSDRTYGMRAVGDFVGDPEANRIRLSGISNPSDYFILVDSRLEHQQWYALTVSWTPDEPGAHLRHSGMANALMADGSVRREDGAYFTNLGYRSWSGD